jgi:hypothetical protein
MVRKQQRVRATQQERDLLASGDTVEQRRVYMDRKKLERQRQESKRRVQHKR